MRSLQKIQTSTNSFNSMIVRLKGLAHFPECAAIVGFNSMIVRLKVAKRTSIARPCTPFQFYDSPIKSLNTITYMCYKCMCFNSMIVRLKVEDAKEALESNIEVSIL